MTDQKQQPQPQQTQQRRPSSTIMKQTKKAVQFDTEKMVNITSIENSHDLSLEEKSLRWLQPSDYVDIQQTMATNLRMRLTTSKKLMKEKEECERGLERWVLSETKLKKRDKAMQDAIQAVLKEQRQSLHEKCCEDRIAYIYNAKSKSAKQIAYKMGLKDALEVSQQRLSESARSSTASTASGSTDDHPSLDIKQKRRSATQMIVKVVTSVVRTSIMIVTPVSNDSAMRR